MQKLRVFSACDGISGGLMSLDELSIDCLYTAIEIDPVPRLVSDSNFKHIIDRPVNDVNEITREMVQDIGPVDLFLAGTECTSLSSQGKRDDWDGKSRIFFKVAEICEWFKELNPDMKILFENVASMRLTARDEMSRILGLTAFKASSALTSGQGRERYYWFNWDAPEIEDQGIMANDILDDDGLHVVAYTKSNRNKPGEPAIVKGRQRKDGKSATITTGPGGRGQSTANFVITKKMKIRNLSVREVARLQSIPDWYLFDMISVDQAYKCIGNGWEIGMIKKLLRKGLNEQSS